MFVQIYIFFILFVPSPGLWTLQNEGFLSDDYEYEWDVDDDDNDENDGDDNNDYNNNKDNGNDNDKNYKKISPLFSN